MALLLGACVCVRHSKWTKWPLKFGSFENNARPNEAAKVKACAGLPSNCNPGGNSPKVAYK